MVRQVATVLMACCVAGSVALSQAKPGGFARQAAMGGTQAGAQVVLNPFIMDDPAIQYLNPAYQTMYKDYIWLNIGGGTLTGTSSSDNGYGFQNAGINFALSRNFTLGAIFSYDPSAAAGVSGLMSQITQRPSQSVPPILNVWELVGSLDMGALDLGLAFTYGNGNSDSTVTLSSPFPAGTFEREASASMFGFRAGAYYDMGGGSSLEGAVALRLDNATDLIKGDSAIVPFGTGEYSASGTEISVTARAKLKMSNRVNLVPFGAFATISAEPTEDTPPRGATANPIKVSTTGTAMALGVGAELRTPTVYIAGGLSYQRISLEIEAGPDTLKSTSTNSYTGLPVINLGAEWWFLDWLAGRGGYMRSIGSLGTEFETRGLTREGNNTLPFSNVLIGGLNPSTWDGVVTLGIGMKFGGFSLDATVSEEALRRGFGLLGSGDNLNTFGYINASVNFD